MQHFVQALSKNNTNCTELAWSTVRGLIDMKQYPAATHAVANYKYYVDKMSSSNEVWVVRTEYLWQDLVRMDRLLGGNGDFGEKHGSNVTYGSEKFLHGSKLSSNDYRTLCCALYDELDVYRKLLWSSTNLKESSKEETWQETIQKCSFASWESSQKECVHLTQ